MSDLGSHWNDLAWWALELDAPLTVDLTAPSGAAFQGEVTPHLVQGGGDCCPWREEAEITLR